LCSRANLICNARIYEYKIKTGGGGAERPKKKGFLTTIKGGEQIGEYRPEGRRNVSNYEAWGEAKSPSEKKLRRARSSSGGENWHKKTKLKTKIKGMFIERG